MNLMNLAQLATGHGYDLDELRDALLRVARKEDGQYAKEMGVIPIDSAITKAFAQDQEFAVLFDFNSSRYGYYENNGWASLALLDEGYKSLKDWAGAFNEAPDLLLDLMAA